MCWPKKPNESTQPFDLYFATTAVMEEGKNAFRSINFPSSQSRVSVDFLEKDIVYSIQVFDSFGVHWYPRVTIPTVPTDLTASEVSSDQVILSHRPSQDFSPIVDYVVYRDGKEIGKSATGSFTDFMVEAGAEYLYTVRALNSFGQLSVSADSVSVKIPMREARRTRHSPADPPSIRAGGRSQRKLKGDRAKTARESRQVVDVMTATGGSPTGEPVLFSMYAMEKMMAGDAEADKTSAESRPDVDSSDFSTPKSGVAAAKFNSKGMGVGDVERMVREGFKTLAGGSSSANLSARVKADQMRLHDVAQAIRSKLTIMTGQKEADKKAEPVLAVEKLPEPLGSNMGRAEERENSRRATGDLDFVPDSKSSNVGAGTAIAASPTVDASGEIPFPAETSLSSKQEEPLPETNVSDESLPASLRKTSLSSAEDIVSEARNMAHRVSALAPVRALTHRFSAVPAADPDSQDAPRSAGAAPGLYVLAGLMAICVLLRI